MVLFVKVTTYQDTKSASATQSWSTSTTGARTYNANYKTNSAGQWFYGYKGTVTNTYFDDYWPNAYSNNFEWSSANPSEYYYQFTGDGITDSYTIPIGTTAIYGYPVTDEMDEDAYDPPDGGNPAHYSVTHYFANNVQWNFVNSEGRQVHMEVDARTTTKLFTGGKAQINRRNLIQLQCDGTEYGRPSVGVGIYPYPWAYLQRTPLDKSRMRALGQWVGADGNLWVSLPDNAAMDLKLCAQARHYYAWAKPIKYPVTIWASSSTTNCDISTNTPEFCVGQRVTFTLSNLPTANIASKFGHWSLPTKYVNEQWQEQQWIPIDGGGNGGHGYWEPYGSVNYRINSSLLQNTDQTSCWFVNGNGGYVGVGLTLTFQNGQSASVVANGTVKMFRPKMTQFTNYPPFIPMLTNRWVELGLDGYRPPGTAIDFVGLMNFQSTVETKTNFPGKVNWTQINDRHVDYVPLYSTIGYELDGSEFIGMDTDINPTNTIPFIDNPGITTGAWPNVNITDYFQTYLRFKPSGDGIWVTLGYVYWGWSEDEWRGTTIISTNVISPIYIDYDGWPVWSDVTHSSPGT